MTAAVGHSRREPYQVVADGHTEPAETYPWTEDARGIITAMDRAATLSLAGTPHSVLRADGSRLARYAAGLRSDLPAAGAQ
jgi:hypothetical protein